ncbi:MAG: NAD(P)H-quinone oxidoreductase, partial [Cellvibrionaceae bacterium]|nr:NAD(P)H-quinone oxidoreductase [Cellvibrionaceae bacterium]
HHGMVIMGLPYSEQDLSTTQTGGSPYGASHLGGEQGKALSDEECRLAQALGRRLAKHGGGND